MKVKVIKAYTVECFECGETIDPQITKEDAVGEAVAEGYEVIGNETFCADCAEKIEEQLNYHD